MFLLRIAEALVTSQESHLNSAIRMQNDDGKSILFNSWSNESLPTSNEAINGNFYSPSKSDTKSLVSKSESASGLLNSDSIHLENVVTTNTSEPMIKSTTVFPSVVTQPDLSDKQSNQGLLYNLLIAKESCTQNGVKSNRKSANSLHKHLTRNEGRAAKENGYKRTGQKQQQQQQQITNHNDKLQSNIDPVNDKNGTSNLNSRNRANSMGCKQLNSNNNRPYIRLHASSVGAKSDYYTSVKARLQRLRSVESVHTDSIFCKPKGALKHKSLPKLHENSMNNSNSHTDSRYYNHFATLPPQSLSPSSSSSSGMSSPHIYQQSLSAQCRLVSQSFAHVTPQNSSGFCSAGAHQSPIGSSLSTDSGSDEPIDLTGYTITNSPTIAMDPIKKNKQVTKNNNNFQSPFIQLAKKTASPVQARITEWLKQATEFVALCSPLVTTMKPSLAKLNKSHKCFHNLCELDGIDVWMSIFAQCWHKLLALSMVEHALDLVVVEDKSNYELNHVQLDFNQLSIPWALLQDIQEKGLKSARTNDRRPDRKFVNELLQFMSEIRQAGVTSQEFYLLRHVILLTVDEPDNTSNLGLSVIQASRCMDYENEQKVAVVNILQNNSTNQCHQYRLPTTKECNENHQTMSFDLAWLACGLKTMLSICPYQMANLFCGHLLTGPNLNKSFVLDMHMKYLSALHDLQQFSSSQMKIEANKHSNIPILPVQHEGILEKLFDSS